jgi:drug/metabolite transporter (DMT)-like permease
VNGGKPSYQDNRRGIAAVMISCALFSGNDILIKLTTLIYPASEVLFVRGLVTILGAVAALIYVRESGWLKASIKPSVLLRSSLEASGHICFIVAISRMRLADLLAISLISPVILTLFLAVFLKEPVGWRRWIAIFVGLAGALLIVKPSPSTLNVWALLALVGATTSALREVATRRIPNHVPTLAVSFSSLVAITLGGTILAAVLGDQWLMLPLKYLLFTAGAAILLTIGIFFAVNGFRNVDITVVAPFRYTLLLWGVIAGFVVFGEIPDAISFVGMVMIVGSGLYILHRERVRHRAVSAKAAIY